LFLTCSFVIIASQRYDRNWFLSVCRAMHLGLIKPLFRTTFPPSFSETMDLMTPFSSVFRSWMTPSARWMDRSLGYRNESKVIPALPFFPHFWGRVFHDWSVDLEAPPHHPSGSFSLFLLFFVVALSITPLWWALRGPTVKLAIFRPLCPSMDCAFCSAEATSSAAVFVYQAQQTAPSQLFLEHSPIFPLSASP